MENKLGAISCEKDLEIYEKRLRIMDEPNCKIGQMHFSETKNDFIRCMTFCKGKMVRIQTISGNCYKTGILLEVGMDFITIRIGNSYTTVVVPINQVDNITVIHNNRFK